LQSLGRRRHGCRRQCGRHRPEFRQILSGGHYLPRDLAVECVRFIDDRAPSTAGQIRHRA
jgi:hypothetical protein